MPPVSRSRRPRRATPTAVAAVVAIVSAAGCNDDAPEVVREESPSTATVAAGGAASPSTSVPRDRVDQLDDGEHVVIVESVDPSQQTITVDAVEVLTGAAAVFAYLEDTGGQLGENPLYLRNRTSALQTFVADPRGSWSVADPAAAPGTGAGAPQEVDLAGFASALVGAEGGERAYRIAIEDDIVTGATPFTPPPGTNAGG